MQSMKSGLFHLLFLFFVALMFGICIFSLFSYHIYLMCQNLTTLGKNISANFDFRVCCITNCDMCICVCVFI